MFSGFVHLSPQAFVIVLVTSYVFTIFAAELYLHRSRSHRAISFHPVLCNFFRAWLFLTNFGVTVKQWVAVHRKHHAKADTHDDPHSPVVHGVWKVLTRGTLLYRKAARDNTLIHTYGVGIHEDWMDVNLYAPHRYRGAFVFLLVEIFAFGVQDGTLIWLFQVTLMPLWAAGFINGIFHCIGYRNTSTKDASRNFVPWGILFCGAELHNNHHANPGSAKASLHWWEFDGGWLVIRVMEFLRLVKINRI